MDENEKGCCLIILVAFVLIIAMITNPSIEQAKKKLESDYQFRNTVISQGEARLYRAGYFIFSEYYVGIGNQKPYHYWNGAFLMFFDSKSIISTNNFDESVDLK